MWIGAAIAWLDRTLNRGRARRARGVAALLVVLALAGVPSWALQAAVLRWLPHPVGFVPCWRWPPRRCWPSAACGPMCAQWPPGCDADSPRDGRPCPTSSAATRTAWTQPASPAPRSRAWPRTFRDGIVAPALWCALLGLPGIALYKAINTADSMIGHRTPRHEAFGWAAARLDDLVNLPASRLSALLLALASGPRAGPALRAVRRDASRHRSPNAGWPEAAMAGALGLRLAGPRTYGTERVDDAWMGDGRPDATPADIERALRLFRLACAAGVGSVLAGAGLESLFQP